jgi:hypothetical protein
MGHLDPIAYTYEADYHCPPCAKERFGEDELGFVPSGAEDDEGNPIGAVASWDEWYDVSKDECEILVCGTCRDIISFMHYYRCEDESMCEMEFEKHV